jgi:hypothetical protein
MPHESIMNSLAGAAVDGFSRSKPGADVDCFADEMTRPDSGDTPFLHNIQVLDRITVSMLACHCISALIAGDRSSILRQEALLSALEAFLFGVAEEEDEEGGG